jgi:anthranilate phosphoribosyltransferase
MIREAIAKLVIKEDLLQDECESVMQEIMKGEATPSQISSFITALRMKGETPEEIAGCARVMRANSIKVVAKTDQIVDTCGTGGDGTGTFNISTAVAFVLAGAGCTVAKHGNRSVSSKCGSADVLEELGVKIELTPEDVGRCIDEIDIGFLFAPGLHPAMKHAAVPRRELGIRTVFNLLGPLTNPASATMQLIGVYDPNLTETIARVLSLLGTKSALVVYGADGLDELSTTGKNKVTELINGEITTYYIEPEQYGLRKAEISDLKGGLPQENAETLRSLLNGEKNAKRDVLLLNAAAGLFVADMVKNISDGIEMAADTVDSGKALLKLEKLIELSRNLAGGGS